MTRLDSVNVAAGGALALVGAIYLYLAGEYPVGSPGSPGPGMLPTLVGIGELLSGLAIAILGLRGRFAAIEPPETPESAPRAVALREASLVAMLVAYALLLPILGFVLVTTALVAGFTALGGTTRWRILVTIPVALSLALHWLFTTLGVKLPVGMLFAVAGHGGFVA